jgi:MoaA/NifB/PqqE/SkfB family radical SAM enzyme
MLGGRRRAATLHGMTAPLESPDVLHIPTGNGCNNRCVFCMERGEGYPVRRTLADLRATLERMRSQLTDVVFTGGEPMLNPLLPELVACAAALDYRLVGLVTNGRTLGADGVAEGLLRAGLNKLTVSLHGADAAVHDGITRRRGSFDQTVAGLAVVSTLRSRWAFALEINTTLVRANLAQMAAIRALVSRFDVDTVNFNATEPRGTADELFGEVVPRHDEVIEHAERSGLRFAEPGQSLSRLPPCAGPVAWVQETWHVPHLDTVDVFQPAAGRVKGEPCRTCAALARCEGLWERYAAGYGWEGLIPPVDPSARTGEVLRVLLGAPCNNRCRRCLDGPASNRPAPRRTVARQLREGWLRGYRAVELTGGEPMLDEHLADHVRLAREIGYLEIAVETNGRILALPARASWLAALGLHHVVVTLEADDEATHDHLARVPGAHGQTMRGLHHLRHHRIPCIVRIR